MLKTTLVAAAVLASTAGGARADVRVLTGNAAVVRDEVRLVIGAAENDVVCAMDRFDDYSMADALITAAKRGRRVRVVLDGEPGPANKVIGVSMAAYLEGGGCEVAVNRGVHRLFSRFVVVDAKAVVVSYPFLADAAASPLADAVVLEDEAAAQTYAAFFEYIWSQAK